MQNAPEFAPESAILRSRPSLFILYFVIVFLVYCFSLCVYNSLPKPTLSAAVYSNRALLLSFLLFLVLSFLAKPSITADSQGVCFNNCWRKRRFNWSQIGEVEWRPAMRGVPGSMGATYVHHMDPVFKDHEDGDLALIDYNLWGRTAIEQQNFIEFVGQKIQVDEK